MHTFELKIWDDESRYVTFYTVHREGHSLSEIDKFLEKIEQNNAYLEELNHLLEFLFNAMGERHGAANAFFNRHENQVDALPPKGKVKIASINYAFNKFPLRLFALKITDEIVILFNGGIKDAPTIQQCSGLSIVWHEACQYADKILKELHKTIIIDEEKRQLSNPDGNKIVFN
ncbi:MAG: hypothetical protein U0V04_06805 [Spirosomataceae bacterium]